MIFICTCTAEHNVDTFDLEGFATGKVTEQNKKSPACIMSKGCDCGKYIEVTFTFDDSIHKLTEGIKVKPESDMIKYKVNFTYIHNGQAAHEFIELPKDETKEPIDVVKEQWQGLLCSHGGLRNILSVEKVDA